jgi:N-acetylglucosaminyldiphosphoundecaprenol N-acetyl-beta-D-mannosaminyltransferase
MTAALGALKSEPHKFVGGRPGQSEAIAQAFGVRGVHFSPEFRAFSAENAAQDWAQFLRLCPGGEAPRLVWVGLGAPKQELWMECVSRLAPRTVFLGVGAAFDFLSESKRRAPKWAQRSGLEWAHRLVSEPQRLGVRYLTTNARFGWLVAKGLLHKEPRK